MISSEEEVSEEGVSDEEEVSEEKEEVTESSEWYSKLRGLQAELKSEWNDIRSQRQNLNSAIKEFSRVKSLLEASKENKKKNNKNESKNDKKK